MPTRIKTNKDFTEGYYKGRADMKKEIEEHSVFYSNRPIEDIVFEARADAIKEFVAKCEERINEICNKAEDDIPFLDIFDINKIAQQLKEQK